MKAINIKKAIKTKIKVGDNRTIISTGHGTYKGYHTNKQGEKQYFNTLQLWKVNVLSGTAGASPVTNSPEIAAPVDISAEPGQDDDLPF